MKKILISNIINITSLTISFLLASVTIAYAQSPLLSEGGVDTHLYKCDTVMFESTVMEDGSGTPGSREFSAGLSMLHSPYISIFYVPLKYGLNDNYSISFSLPYLTKTLVYNDTHYIKSGYGDTMFGFTGAFQPFEVFSTITTARLTLPTGNVNAQDFDYYIPLGYGGYTASLQETISIGSFDTGLFTTRLFISGIGIYYFQSEQKIDTVEKNTYEPSFAWGVMGGLEFGLTENLDLQLKANYINVNERKYENNTVPGEKIDADDSVKQVNILPFIKYRFLDDIIGQTGIIYPVKTTQDSDITKIYDAKWKFAFGIEKRFSDNSSYNTTESNKKEETAAYERVKSREPSDSEKNLNKSKSNYTSKKKRKRRR